MFLMKLYQNSTPPVENMGDGDRYLMNGKQQKVAIAREG